MWSAFAHHPARVVAHREDATVEEGFAEAPALMFDVAAAEMVLVRIAYAADLPTPDEVVRSLSENGGARRPVRRGTAVR